MTFSSIRYFGKANILLRKIRDKTKRNAQISYLSEHDNCNYLPIKSKLEDLQIVKTEKITVNELFSGIGAQVSALERLGIPCEIKHTSDNFNRNWNIILFKMSWI